MWSRWPQSRKRTAVLHLCYAGRPTRIQVPRGICLSLRCFVYLLHQRRASVKSPFNRNISAKSFLFESLQQRTNQTDGSHDGLGDSGVSAHPQIVVAAPHRNLCLKRVCVAVCHWEGEGTAVQRLKNPVCVLALPAVNHLFKELVVLKSGSCKEKL